MGRNVVMLTDGQRPADICEQNPPREPIIPPAFNINSKLSCTSMLKMARGIHHLCVEACLGAQQRPQLPTQLDNSLPPTPNSCNTTCATIDLKFNPDRFTCRSLLRSIPDAAEEVSRKRPREGGGQTGAL